MRRQFERYLDLLTLWNRSQRLTGVLSADRIVSDLFIDSLLFLKVIPPGALRVADIGAGAGIPGIPIVLARPEIAITLIDSRRKRASFLLAVRRELGIDNLRVLEGRAEELVEADRSLSEGFDVVVTRAAGPTAIVLPIAMSYLSRGGLFVAGGSSGLEQPDIPGTRRESVELKELRIHRTLLLATKLT